MAGYKVTVELGNIDARLQISKLYTNLQSVGLTSADQSRWDSAERVLKT